MPIPFGKRPLLLPFTRIASPFTALAVGRGDVVTFVRRMENLDYIEAVKFLAQRAGLAMPEDGYDDSYAKLKTRILEINRETARFYHQCLISPLGKKGLDYLRERGLSDKTIRHFGLGLRPKAGMRLSSICWAGVSDG